MKNIKIKKVLIIVAITLIVIIGSFNKVFASVDIVNQIEISQNGVNDLSGAGNKILTLVKYVGAVGAVIALMIIGIKYMVGSVEEKAEYKKTLPIYILGCVLAFGLCALAGPMYELINSAFNSL